MKRNMKHSLGIGALGIAAITLAGCGLQPAAAFIPAFEQGSIEPIPEAEGESIAVTSKNFTEQLILGKIAVLTAEAIGFEVQDLTNVPGSVPSRELMLSGQVQIAWEYTGTAWLTYMNQEGGIADKDEQWQVVYDMDLQNGLTWSDPSELNNTYAFGVRSDFAEEHGITAFSEVADLPPEERTLCVEPEFNSRSDGLDPVLEHYGMTRDDFEISLLDTGAIYSAVAQGTCNLGEIFSSDGRIPALDLVVLEDDEEFFPAYNASVVFNTEMLEQYPEVEDRFMQVIELANDETLQALNQEVDVDGREPIDVAYDWMVSEGLINPAE